MTTQPDLSRRLTVRPNEAAALLGVSRRSIERAIRNGRLRSTKTIGGRLIIAADVLSLAGVGVTPRPLELCAEPSFLIMMKEEDR
jgi:excisionase family DNA binding protein